MNDHPHKLDGIHHKQKEGKQQFPQGFMQPLQEFAHAWQTANKEYVTDDFVFCSNVRITTANKKKCWNPSQNPT